MIILEDLFPKVAIPFLNNIRVKGLYLDYNREIKLPGIRRFIYKYLLNLNLILDQIKRLGAKIRVKSKFCTNNISIIRFITKSEGKVLASSKIIKILK